MVGRLATTPHFQRPRKFEPPRQPRQYNYHSLEFQEVAQTEYGRKYEGYTAMEHWAKNCDATGGLFSLHHHVGGFCWSHRYLYLPSRNSYASRLTHATLALREAILNMNDTYLCTEQRSLTGQTDCFVKESLLNGVYYSAIILHQVPSMNAPSLFSLLILHFLATAIPYWEGNR